MTYWKLKSFFTLLPVGTATGRDTSAERKKAQKKHTSITTDVNTKQYKRSDSIYTATTAKYGRATECRAETYRAKQGKKATFLKEKRKGEKGT